MQNWKKEEKPYTEEVAGRAREIGARLQQDRQDAGFSRQELEHLTRISPSFLEALEEGHFWILPGEVFCKGFLKNIYRTLKRDPAPILQEIADFFIALRLATPERRKSSSGRKVRSLSTSSSHDRRPRHRPFLMLVAAATVAGIFLWQGRSTTPPAVSSSPPQLRSENPAGTPPPSAIAQKPALAVPLPTEVPTPMPTLPLPPLPQQPAPAMLPTMNWLQPGITTPHTVILTVRAPVGIRQKIDHAGSLSKEFPPGTYPFSFQEKAEFVVDDASEVSFTYDSKKMEVLGKKKEIKRISFVPSKKDPSLMDVEF